MKYELGRKLQDIVKQITIASFFAISTERNIFHNHIILATLCGLTGFVLFDKWYTQK